MHRRDNEGLEFDRMAFFSDAVYAIAMTLLIVAIALWIVSGPTGGVLNRWMPADFATAFGD